MEQLFRQVRDLIALDRYLSQYVRNRNDSFPSAVETARLELSDDSRLEERGRIFVPMPFFKTFNFPTFYKQKKGLVGLTRSLSNLSSI